MQRSSYNIGDVISWRGVSRQEKGVIVAEFQDGYMTILDNGKYVPVHKDSIIWDRH